MLQSLLGTEVDYGLSTIYSVDFETMHQHLMHPSGEVLQKAGKYVKDFPDIKIPSEHFCPGCAQGKMTQKPFPASETRATELFELIHSDLKMQPVESYRKYRYTITFLTTLHLTPGQSISGPKTLLSPPHVTFWRWLRRSTKCLSGLGCPMLEANIPQWPSSL